MVDRSNFFFDFGVLILEYAALFPFVVQQCNHLGFLTTINLNIFFNILMMSG